MSLRLQLTFSDTAADAPRSGGAYVAGATSTVSVVAGAIAGRHDAGLQETKAFLQGLVDDIVNVDWSVASGIQARLDEVARNAFSTAKTPPPKAVSATLVFTAGAGYTIVNIGHHRVFVHQADAEPLEVVEHHSVKPPTNDPAQAWLWDVDAHALTNTGASAAPFVVHRDGTAQEALLVLCTPCSTRLEVPFSAVASADGMVKELRQTVPQGRLVLASIVLGTGSG